MKKILFYITCIFLLYPSHIFSQENSNLVRVIIYDTDNLLKHSDLAFCESNITRFINECRSAADQEKEKLLLPELKDIMMSDKCKRNIVELWKEERFSTDFNTNIIYAHLNKNNDSIFEARIHNLIFRDREEKGEQKRYTGVFHLSKNELLYFYISDYSDIHCEHYIPYDNIIRNFIDEFLIAYMKKDYNFIYQSFASGATVIEKKIKTNKDGKENIIENELYEQGKNDLSKHYEDKFNLNNSIELKYNIRDLTINDLNNEDVLNNEDEKYEKYGIFIDFYNNGIPTKIFIKWAKPTLNMRFKKYIMELEWTEYYEE